MGNQLTVEGIIENIEHYAPNMAVYELLSRGGLQVDQSIKVWQHRFTSQRLIQKQYIATSWLQFTNILQSFSFRYNNPFVIASKHITISNSQSLKSLSESNHDNFPITTINIFYEASIINLSCFKQIPQQDGAYVLVQCLKGFGALVKRLKFPFEVREEMFHITAGRKFKVWLGGDVADISTVSRLTPLLFESNMIRQILSIIKSNIFFTTSQSSHNMALVIDQLITLNPQSFQKAIQLAQTYLNQYNIKVGTFMSCLKDFTSQELERLMQKNKGNGNVVQQPRYAVSTDNNSLAAVNNNNSSLISIRPLTPQSNTVFSTQSLGPQILMHRNHSMGNLMHYQSQSKLFQSKAPHSANSVKNSRSKSKRSGLSLVKNQSLNHNSTTVSKQQKRPVTSFVPNQVTMLKLGGGGMQQQQHAKMMPPRASSSAKKVNFITTTISQPTPIPLTPSQPPSPVLQLSNHTHSRGISITRKQHSNQKQVVVRPFSPPKPIHRTNHHCNTQLSSTISVGTLPSPKYESRKQTAVMFNNNQLVELVGVSPSKMYQPNQSLTRFQTQKIILTNPPSANATVNSFYQVPRIYIHSPKSQQKILRVDSTSTQQQSRQKQQLKHQPVVTQFPTNDVKQTLSENQSQVFYYPTPQSKRVSFQLPIKEKQQPTKAISEMHNYEIEEGANQLFTHPALYDYITGNNNKPQRFMRQQQSKANSKRTSSKHFSYIDYLASAHIAESIDSSTPPIQKLAQIGSNNNIKQPLKKDDTIISERRFTLNDFPTIEEIDEPQHTYETNNEREAKNGNKQQQHVVEMITLKSNNNLGSRNQLSSVRRGYEESQVFQYKKFDCDTHRDEQTPRRCQPSQFNKKNDHVQNNVDSNRIKQYSTAETWQPMSPQPVKQQTPPKSKPLFPPQEYRHPPIVIAQRQNEQRHGSPSPLSKIIYNGTKQPAINPLLLQDMQKIRQNQIC